MPYLLDTNVLSEIRKNHMNPNVLRWLRLVPVEQCYISVISLGEIRRGIEKRRTKDSHYADIFERWLEQLERVYEGRIWPFDRVAADLWGRLPVPDPTHLVDAEIAAIALQHDAILVTRNVKDFKDFGLDLVNPFEAA